MDTVNGIFYFQQRRELRINNFEDVLHINESPHES